MTAYYNEFDAYAAQWLRNLIKRGLIAGGEVDERSIEEVHADDLRGFTQAHFFAGIGGWSLAARFAGWPDDRPLWTGSCPCQPFSTAGQKRGESDERHLWPTFHSLIDELRPPAVCGEQVSSRLGYEWLSGVRVDLEASGYAVGAVDLCAASVGAPHIRQRLWWMAYAQSPRQQARPSNRMGADDQSRRNQGQLESESSPDSVADADQLGQARKQAGRWQARGEPSGSGSGLGNAAGQRLEGSREARATPWAASGSIIYIPCADGKSRRIESSIEPLAHGVPNRVGRLRAYGNAIVPQVGAEIIKAMMQARP